MADHSNVESTGSQFAHPQASLRVSTVPASPRSGSIPESAGSAPTVSDTGTVRISASSRTALIAPPRGGEILDQYSSLNRSPISQRTPASEGQGHTTMTEDRTQLRRNITGNSTPFPDGPAENDLSSMDEKSLRRGDFGSENERPLPKIPTKSVEERLLPTLEVARNERTKAQRKAMLTGWALNIAIGLQVVIGSLITGLSAVTSGRSTSIMVSVLGALSTMVASFLARARGTNEPERSKAHGNTLQEFVREVEAFVLDFGNELGSEFDPKVREFRERFEELQGSAQK
ncbi:hypothetical protein BOTBODRAFT_176020 [Botryobasidium botryosum FD-172 SS1]|uniref:SMODS and SLOG-associating 2TM effector domain-containing protein n=1 Tax=Botryobasidium botryosum (strain FD-172 SS1) TaxID=930990 RepID=A0A067MMU2_BOTB1|nr:hypothetical protein BOTBODRAFT_176020 [Botryobasidium botryosum FD-172 SS1]